MELKPKFIEGKFYDCKFAFFLFECINFLQFTLDEANKMKGTLQPKIFRFHDVIRPGKWMNIIANTLK